MSPEQILYVLSGLALLSSTIFPVLMFRVFKETDAKYATKEQVGNLSKAHIDLKDAVGSMDYTARTEFDKEVIRLSGQATDGIRDLRASMEANDNKASRRAYELRKKLDKVMDLIALVQQENNRIRQDFELYKKDVEHRLKDLERQQREKTG